MKYLYTDVPDCPRCKSPCTGYFLYGITEKDKAWAEERAIRRGEYVRALGQGREAGSLNFFCQDCGMQWCGPQKRRWITHEELRHEKERKGITAEAETDVIQLRKEQESGKTIRRLKSLCRKATDYAKRKIAKGAYYEPNNQ